MSLGLSTYRWNNNIKSIVVLAAFPLLLLALAYGILVLIGWGSVMPDGGVDPRLLHSVDLPAFSTTPPLDFASMAVTAYWPIVFGIAAIWMLLGYLFNGAMIRAATGAKPVDRREAPQLYNLLENLCIARGIKMPALYIIDTRALNAFASGINENNFSVTVTRGLLERLDEKELEAVLAHELSHIINRDVRLLIITIVFTGMLSFIAQMMWRNLRFVTYGRNNDRERSGPSAFVLVLLASIMLTIGYLLAMLLRFALSRKREYLADAGSVELTKNPEALIAALQKISGNADIPNVPPEVQQMFIENPPSLFGLFDTHPPIAERIKILRALGGLPDQGESIIPRTK